MNPHYRIYKAGAAALMCVGLLRVLVLPSALAGPMVNDPNGFEGIPWGAGFSESADFVLAEKGDRIKGYELKKGPPPLGQVKVDTMRFFTIDGKFARVTVRYHGRETHEQVLRYLQTQFGSLDRAPGQNAGGAIPQSNWLGDDTQINVTYEAQKDRGIIFFESRALASKFAEGMAPDPDLAGATY